MFGEMGPHARLAIPRRFAFAVVIILLWAVTGPVFHFSDTWQL